MIVAPEAGEMWGKSVGEFMGEILCIAATRTSKQGMVVP